MVCLSPADSIHATSLFGTGVRVGYYLQWYTLILEERYLDQEFPATKVSLLLFMVANALTVLIKIKELDPVVIYVTLLLTFGYWYNILPLIAWFFIALLSKKLRLNWNASIFPRSREPDLNSKDCGHSFSWAYCLTRFTSGSRLYPSSEILTNGVITPSGMASSSTNFRSRASPFRS